MPGQEKMIMEYYQKNPSATQSLKGGIYEEKIIKLLKSKIKISTKNITISEAEKLISEFNKPASKDRKLNKPKAQIKTKAKTKK